MASRKPTASKRKDGRYMARVTVTLPNGKRKRLSFYGKTSAEAVEKWNKAQAESVNGTLVDRSNLTLEQYLANWLPNAKNIRESTREKYNGVLRKHVLPILGKHRLSSLSVEDIQNMMDQLRHSDRSVRTTQIIRSILSKALKGAEVKNLVRPNLVKYIELDHYAPKERVIWNKEQVQTFLNGTKNHPYELFFNLYAIYGLRRGEAIGLMWEDIDFEHKVIHIRRQYTYVGKRPSLCDLKTDSSKRDLPLLDDIEVILKKLSKAPENAKGFIIAENESPIKPSKVNWEFKKITKQLGLPKVVLHSLRHYTATALKRAGVSVKDAQKILGHASIQTTLQNYQHADTEDMKEALLKTLGNTTF